MEWVSRTQHILTARTGGLGRIHLDRPDALNALTHEMVRTLTEQLTEWALDNEIEAVAITGEGRAFSAGGDIRAIYERGIAGEPFDEFFADEYALNILIREYPKPIVALVNGIAMGGGVGVAYNAQTVIVGENARFAMPECSIGFFPDVGASHFLNRIVGGAYLGLTGTRIGPGDQDAIGLATFVPSERWGEILAAMADGGRWEDAVPAPRAPAPEAVIDWHAVQIAEKGTLLDRIVGGGPWTEAAGKGDPLALAVTARQLTEAATLEFRDCMRMEARMAYRMLREPGFYEGIRAAVIEKDGKPKWRHESVRSVTAAEVDRYFDPVPEGPLSALGGP